jgi:hypothetical protein
MRDTPADQLRCMGPGISSPGTKEKRPNTAATAEKGPRARKSRKETANQTASLRGETTPSDSSTALRERRRQGIFRAKRVRALMGFSLWFLPWFLRGLMCRLACYLPGYTARDVPGAKNDLQT